MAEQQHTPNNTHQEPPIRALLKYIKEWIKSNVLLVLAIPSVLLFMSYYEDEYVDLVHRVAHNLNNSTWGYPLVGITLGFLIAILLFCIVRRIKKQSNADSRTVYAAVFVTIVFVFTCSVLTPGVVPQDNLPASIKFALGVCMVLLWCLCFIFPLFFFLGNKRMNNQLEKKSEAQSQAIGYIDDEPVADSEKDVLGHKPYVQELIKRIQGIRLNHTGSIAITGSWGAGKSSFVRLLEEELKSKNHKDEFIFLTFEPMRCERPELIQSAFFDQLEFALSQYRTGFARHFRLYKELIGAVDNKYLGFVTTLFSITQEEEFVRIQRAIQSLHRHVVVFIDDVDRLERDELVQIFRLVRFNAKFNNLVFLLAMDKTKVEATMGATDNFSDKFAETEFYLPVQSPKTVWDYIVDKITEEEPEKEVKKELSEKEPSYDFKNDSSLKPFVRHCLPTIRDAKRFVNSFRLRLNAMNKSKEYIFRDYFLLSLLHYADPEAFGILARNESFKSDVVNNGLTIDRAQLRGTKTESDDILWQLVQALFPLKGGIRTDGDRHGINDNEYILIYFNEVFCTIVSEAKSLLTKYEDYNQIETQVKSLKSDSYLYNNLIQYFKDYQLDNLSSDDPRVGKYFIVRHILGIEYLDFHEDFVAVEKGGKYGFVDQNGALKIPFEYDGADVFSEGFAAVEKGGEWGYVDQNGAVEISFEYDHAGLFSESLAAVEKDGKWGYIDQSGAVKIPFEYDFARWFSEGLAAVEKDGKWGFVDKTGAVKIPFEYDHTRVFSEGLVEVRKDGKYGFVDKDGAVKVPIEYDHAWPFSEGLARVKKGWNWGYIDEDGAVKIPFEYDYAWSFTKDGLAKVKKSGKYGYIDKTGEVKVPIEYDNVWRFSEGLAAVKKGGKWGYVDKDGTVIVPIEYDGIWSFDEGRAWVEKDGETFWIDKEGKRVR